MHFVLKKKLILLELRNDQKCSERSGAAKHSQGVDVHCCYTMIYFEMYRNDYVDHSCGDKIRKLHGCNFFNLRIIFVRPIDFIRHAQPRSISYLHQRHHFYYSLRAISAYSWQLPNTTYNGS